MSIYFFRTKLFYYNIIYVGNVIKLYDFKVFCLFPFYFEDRALFYYLFAWKSRKLF